MTTTTEPAIHTTVRIFHASPFRDEAMPTTTIAIDRPIPELDNGDEAADLYAKQGQKLAEVLFETLPGGTIDQLIAELLRRRASLFRVRFPKREGDDQ